MDSATSTNTSPQQKLEKKVASNRVLLNLVLIITFLSFVQGTLLFAKIYSPSKEEKFKPSNVVIKDADFPAATDNLKTQTSIDESSLTSYIIDLDSDENVKIYTSPKLKVQFQYASKYAGDQIKVTEVGNKIYIYSATQKYNQGQYIEVFEGYGRKTLTNILKDRFLSDVTFKANCEITEETLSATGENPYPSSYQLANIKVKGEVLGLDDLFLKLESCPRPYTQENGISYFIFDTNHIDKYAFVSVGQYGISADANPNGTLLWQDTIRFID